MCKSLFFDKLFATSSNGNIVFLATLSTMKYPNSYHFSNTRNSLSWLVVTRVGKVILVGVFHCTPFTGILYFHIVFFYMSWISKITPNPWLFVWELGTHPWILKHFLAVHWWSHNFFYWFDKLRMLFLSPRAGEIKTAAAEILPSI